MRIDVQEIMKIISIQGSDWWLAVLFLIMSLLSVKFGLRRIFMAIPVLLMMLYSTTKQAFTHIFTQDQDIVEDEDEDNPFRGE